MDVEKSQADAILQRVKELRVRSGDVESEEPESIRFLLSKLDEFLDRDSQLFLLIMLSGEYAYLGWTDKQEDAIRRTIEIDPDNLMSWIGLAGFLCHTKQELDEARRAAEIGISKAAEKDQYVRHAYTTSARIAAKSADYKTLERDIRNLVEYAPGKGSKDIKYESDFLRLIPEGAIDGDLLDEYRKICKSSNGIDDSNRRGIKGVRLD